MTTIATTIMNLDRTTKGAALYKNPKEGDSEAITTIYFRKSGLPTIVPEQVVVTVVVKNGDDNV